MLTHEEWIEQRYQGVGGSEAASVFNVGLGCRRQLFYLKRRVAPDFPFDETLPMSLGSFLEPFFADQYAKKTGRVLSAPSSFSHPEHPELRVNIDRLIDPVPEHNGPGVLEIKSQSSAVFAKTKREGIAEGYILQVQWGLVVTGCRWGSFAIGNRDNGELLYWDVERSDTLCDEILTEGPKLWALIKSDAPLPERLEIDAPPCGRCSYRVQCQGDALMHVSGESDLVEAEDIRPLLAEYDVRKPLFDEAEALLEETEEDIRTALVDRPAVRLGWHGENRKVTFRGQAGKITWRAEEMAQRYDKLRRQVFGESAQAVADFPAAVTFRRQGNPFRRLVIGK